MSKFDAIKDAVSGVVGTLEPPEEVLRKAWDAFLDELETYYTATDNAWAIRGIAAVRWVTGTPDDYAGDTD